MRRIVTLLLVAMLCTGTAFAQQTAPPVDKQAVVQNSWFYYFSSLAQTVAACSALLVALAIVKLQAIANAMSEIERLLAEAFYRIAKHDAYAQQASYHALTENWIRYFTAVQSLADNNARGFATDEDFTRCKAFVDELVARGRKLEAQHRTLRRILATAFVGTVAVAGAAILVLPFAERVSSKVLQWSWWGSGAVLVILLLVYLKLVFQIIRSTK